MFTRVLPFSALAAQGRWKVDFFISNCNGARSDAYTLVPLKDVLAERREFLDPQQYSDCLFNYLGLEHILSLTGDLSDTYRPREGRAVLSRSKVFRHGDLLYGRLRPSLNKVLVADGPIAEGICSGEFYVLIPDSRQLLSHFARAILASRYVQDVVRTMTSGSALPRLALEDLLAIEIPLPPIAIQRQYEELLIAQSAKRKDLMDELREGPIADMEALASALEVGATLSFSRTPKPAQKDFNEVVLPKAVVFSAKGRGRPRASRDSLLF